MVFKLLGNFWKLQHCWMKKLNDQASKFQPLPLSHNHINKIQALCNHLTLMTSWRFTWLHDHHLWPSLLASFKQSPWGSLQNRSRVIPTPPFSFLCSHIPICAPSTLSPSIPVLAYALHPLYPIVFYSHICMHPVPSFPRLCTHAPSAPFPWPSCVHATLQHPPSHEKTHAAWAEPPRIFPHLSAAIPTPYLGFLLLLLNNLCVLGYDDN